MAKLIESHNKIMGSLRKEVTEIRDNLSSSFRLTASSLGSDHTRSFREHHDDEDELQWAAIEKLQNQRQESQDEISVVYGNQKNLPSGSKEHGQGKTVKIGNAIKLESALESHAFIDKLLKKIEEDNHWLLLKQRERINRVGLELPTVEIRYQNLCVEADYEVVYGKSLPTLWNTLKRVFSLILMKRGGQIIYSGELGQHSSKLIEYFENFPGVPKIKENYNPATWMLEVSSPSSEAQLDLDFGQLYKKSHLCWINVHFSTIYGNKQLLICSITYSN